MYQDADIYILDDPLSAVDAEVGRHLFEQWVDTFKLIPAYMTFVRSLELPLISLEPASFVTFKVVSSYSSAGFLKVIFEQ